MIMSEVVIYMHEQKENDVFKNIILPPPKNLSGSATAHTHTPTTHTGTVTHMHTHITTTYAHTQHHIYTHRHTYIHNPTHTPTRKMEYLAKIFLNKYLF